MREIIDFLGELAPPALAEAWDNVGLLFGGDDREAGSVMTCLTLTPDVAAEAVEHNAQLVVSHHPVLFRPVQRLTTETAEGRMLLGLAAAGIAVYSPHTGYDSAQDGINRQLARMLKLNDVRVLRPREDSGEPRTESGEPIGAGRCGDLPEAVTLEALNRRIKEALGIGALQYVGDSSAAVKRLGIACGSAAEFLRDAGDFGCQALLTGEARFHACLEARTTGIALILAGHYATERPAMEHLAEVLAGQFPSLTVWASRVESDPVRWM